MSRSAAKKNSILEHGNPVIALSQNYSMSWQSVSRFVDAAMLCKAGVACVDLDSVILFHDSEDSRLGRVLPLGRKLVNKLRKRWYVVVLTARAKGHQKILTYLHKNNVWVDEVTNRKPYADCYIDDKAVRIVKNWRVR